MDNQIISEKVKVVFMDYPRIVYWKGREIKIDKLGLKHKYFQGKTLCHIFSVSSKDLFLKLKLESDNLTWELLETSFNGI